MAPARAERLVAHERVEHGRVDVVHELRDELPPHARRQPRLLCRARRLGKHREHRM